MQILLRVYFSFFVYIFIITSELLISTLTYQPQIGNTFKSHNEFVEKFKKYTYKLDFTIKLEKVKYLNNNSYKQTSENFNENFLTILIEKKFEKEYYYVFKLDILNQKNVV